MSIYIAHRRKSASNALNVPSILIKKTRLQCTTKTVKNSQFACQSRLWGDLFLQIVVLQVFSCGRQFLVKFILIRPEFSHKLVKPLQVLHYALAFCHLSSWTAWTVDKVAVFFCNENWDLTHVWVSIFRCNENWDLTVLWLFYNCDLSAARCLLNILNSDQSCSFLRDALRHKMWFDLNPATKV